MSVAEQSALMHARERSHAGAAAIAIALVVAGSASSAMPQSSALSLIAVALGCLALLSSAGRVAIVLVSSTMGAGQFGVSFEEIAALTLLAGAAALSGLRKGSGTAVIPGPPVRPWVFLALYAGTVGVAASQASGVDLIVALSRVQVYIQPALAVWVLRREYAHTRFRQMQLLGWIALLALSLLWTVHWAGLRGFLPYTQVGGTGIEPTLLLAATFFLGTRRSAMAPVAIGLAVVLTVMTGSRQSMLIGAVLVIVGLLSYLRNVRSSLTSVWTAGCLVALIVIAFAALPGDNRAQFEARLRLSTQTATAGFGSDASWRERADASMRLAKEAGAHPLFGAGVAYRPDLGITTASGRSGVFAFDSPLVPLVELGAVGVLLLIGSILSLMRWAWSAASRQSAAAWRLWIAATLVATLLVENPIENRSFVPAVLAAVMAVCGGQPQHSEQTA